MEKPVVTTSHIIYYIVKTLELFLLEWFILRVILSLADNIEKKELFFLEINQSTKYQPINLNYFIIDSFFDLCFVNVYILSQSYQYHIHPQNSLLTTHIICTLTFSKALIT